MLPYHFHLRLPGGLERDEVGVSFASLEAAYLQVCETIPTVAGELLREGHDLRRCAYLIADARGATLLEVPFAELQRGAPPRASRARSGAIRQHDALVRTMVARAAAVSRNTDTALTGSKAFVERMRRRHAPPGSPAA